MKTRARADQLQFLRFCAFLLICVYHTGDFQFSWFPKAEGASCAVAFFVVLSGFVSGYSSYDSEIECTPKRIVQYMWKKLKKVYPLYFVTMLFAVGYSSIPNLVALHSFAELMPPLRLLLRCLLLIQSWYPTKMYWFAYNGVGWFLSMIMFLYLLNLPLRALAGRIKKTAKSDLYFGLIFLFSFACMILYCYLTRNTDVGHTQYVLPASRIGEYVCGLAAGYLCFSLGRRLDGNHSRYLPALFSALELLAAALPFVVMYSPTRVWLSYTVRWLLPNCFLIAVFSFNRGILSHICSNKFLVRLGDISFECFLIHQIVIKVYTNLCNITTMSKLGNLFSIVFCVTLTVMIAGLISGKKAKE